MIGFCGYHTVSSSDTLYAVIPYNAVNGHCQSGNPRPNASTADPALSTISHELAETVTDPYGNAWSTASRRRDRRRLPDGLRTRSRRHGVCRGTSARRPPLLAAGTLQPAASPVRASSAEGHRVDPRPASPGDRRAGDASSGTAGSLAVRSRRIAGPSATVRPRVGPRSRIASRRAARTRSRSASPTAPAIGLRPTSGSGQARALTRAGSTLAGGRSRVARSRGSG